MRKSAHLVAQPSAPGSPSLGFPGKSSRQPFSQSTNFVSQSGKFKQPSAHSDFRFSVSVVNNIY